MLKSKILLASSLILGSTITASLVPNLQASAKAYNLSNNFVTSLKQGTLPRAKFKIGTSYATIHKFSPNAKTTTSIAGPGLAYYMIKNPTNTAYDAFPRDNYGFFPRDNDSYGYPIFKSNQKVILVQRKYNYLISRKSIEKKFGKPLKGIEFYTDNKINTGVYKVGKYYALFQINKKTNRTRVSIGTKNGMETEIYCELLK